MVIVSSISCGLAQAVVLCSYLCNPSLVLASSLAGKRVLELGSGTGLVGIAAALRGQCAHFFLPDFEEFFFVRIS